MKIFFTVLIIVLILLIAIRFIALQFYTNDGDVLCYRTEVWWYQSSYYCVKMTPNGRAYFTYYDDLYDSKWILGRSREEIDARFPENWYVGAGNVYYRVRGENSGTYYAVKYGDNNIAIDFWTADSVP